MEIADLLSPDAVVSHLKAASKKQVLQEMAHKAAALTKLPERRIFEIFDRYETSVDMVATSEVSVSLTIDQPERVQAIAGALREFAEVSVDENQAIICMVGENIRHSPGVAARVFKALGSINVRMVSQGASALNLGFVVAGKDLATAVPALHREFFTELDPAVFDA